VAETAKVYLVGAGPGDPDLLTRKAERLLREAGAVIYDRLVSAEILTLANPTAAFIHAGKQRGQQEEFQAEIYAWYLRLRDSPGYIVRLKGGDPMIFGRGGEELEFLARHGFDVEVVPGVSSATAAPALAGIPLTFRGVASSFTVVAGHAQSLQALDWLVYRHIETLVFLMGVENRAVIAASLIQAGRSSNEPAAFVQRASMEGERITESTLGEIARSKIHAVESPAVMIVGQVVRLRTSMRARAAVAAVEVARR
jgi:uroporphyrin-III C-methyltransferase